MQKNALARPCATKLPSYTSYKPLALAAPSSRAEAPSYTVEVALALLRWPSFANPISLLIHY